MSHTTPVTPNPNPASLTPEAVIAQLRTIRSQIDDVAPLSKEQSKLVKQRIRIHPDVVVSSLRSLRCPVHLMRATRNLLNQVPPLIPDALVETWRATLSGLTDEVVEDTNHYTIGLGAKGAGVIGELI